MTPLQRWEKEKAPGRMRGKPVLVVLIDALDEADHDGQGCLPVARLLAKE